MQEDARQSNRLSKSVVLDTIANLRANNAIAVGLDELSSTLGCKRETLRKFCITSGLPNWQQLNVITNEISSERATLRKILRLANSREKQIAILSEVLKLQRSRAITKNAAHILGYAILHKVYDRQGLDEQYARRFKRHPTVISNILHDERIASKCKPGIYDLINRRVSERYQEELQGIGQSKRYSDFVSDLSKLKLLYQKNALFSSSLKENNWTLTLVEQLELVIKNARSAKPLFELNSTQVKLIKALLKHKSGGTYQGLSQTAEECGTTVAAIQRAWTGRKNKSEGVIDRILLTVQEYNHTEQEIVKNAFKRLREDRGISATDRLIIERVLNDYSTITSNAHNIRLSDIQLKILETLVESIKEGNSFQLSTVSDKIGASVGNVYTALYGGKGTPGLAVMLDNYFTRLGQFFDKNLGQPHCEPFLIITADFCRQLSHIADITPEIKKKKGELLAVVEALLCEEASLPNLKIKSTSKNTATRELSQAEKAKLVVATLSDRYASISEIEREASTVLDLPNTMTLAKESLTKYVRGVNLSGYEQKGAINKLAGAIFKNEELLAIFRQVETAGLLANADITSIRSHTDVYSPASLEARYARDILDSEEADQAMTKLNYAMLRKPDDLLSVTEFAIRNISKIQDPLVRQFVIKLQEICMRCVYSLSSPATVEMIIATIESTEAHSTKPNYTSALLLGAQVARCPTDIFADYLANLVSNYRNDLAAILLEQFLSIIKNQVNELDPSIQVYARRAHRRFMEKAFGVLDLDSLARESKFNIPLLISLKEQKLASKKTEEALVCQLVTEFYESYSLEKIIFKFRKHLVQTEDNPNGVPLEELLQTARVAVHEAAQKYDPERLGIKTGQKSKFNSYAIRNICWQTSHYAKDMRRQLRNTSSLDTPLANSDDDTALIDLITNSSTQTLNDLDSERLEQIRICLGMLTPLQRRVIELRYALTSEKYSMNMEKLRVVVKILENEGLVAVGTTEQHVGRIIRDTLTTIQRSLYSNTPDKLLAYIKHPEQHDQPLAILCKVFNGHIVLSSDLVLSEISMPDDTDLVIGIANSSQDLDGSHEVALQVESIDRKKCLAMYCVSAINGRILSCEKIQ